MISTSVTHRPDRAELTGRRVVYLGGGQIAGRAGRGAAAAAAPGDQDVTGVEQRRRVSHAPDGHGARGGERALLWVVQLGALNRRCNRSDAAGDEDVVVAARVEQGGRGVGARRYIRDGGASG